MNTPQDTDPGLSWLERIRKHIATFSGYADPENRQSEDERFRRFLDTVVAGGMVRIEKLVHHVAEEKRLDLLSDFEHILSGLEVFRKELSGIPEGLADAGEPTESIISEWHREDFDFLQSMSAFLDRIEQIPVSSPERNDVLLLKDTLDRLLHRLRDRVRRHVSQTEPGDREGR